MGNVMKTSMCARYLLSVLLGSGCASESEPTLPPTAEVMLAPFTCTGISGVYRVSFVRTTGDCAELPEQLARFTPGANTSALSKDCVGSVETSSDLCDREEETTCAVRDNTGASVGSANLIAVYSQASESRIEGMTTISLVTVGETACTATYSFFGVRVE
jgi:hypothetical protein